MQPYVYQTLDSRTFQDIEEFSGALLCETDCVDFHSSRGKGAIELP